LHREDLPIRQDTAVSVYIVVTVVVVVFARLDAVEEFFR